MKWRKKKNPPGHRPTDDARAVDTTDWFDAEPHLDEQIWEFVANDVEHLALKSGQSRLHGNDYYDLWHLASRFPSAKQIAWEGGHSTADNYFDRLGSYTGPCIQTKISSSEVGQVWQLCKLTIGNLSRLNNVSVTVEYAVELVDGGLLKNVELYALPGRWFVSVNSAAGEQKITKEYVLLVDEAQDANVVVPQLLKDLLKRVIKFDREVELARAAITMVVESVSCNDLSEVMETAINTVTIAPSDLLEGAYDNETPCKVESLIDAVTKALNGKPSEQLRGIIIDPEATAIGIDEEILPEQLYSVLRPDGLTALRDKFPKLRLLVNYDRVLELANVKVCREGTLPRLWRIGTVDVGRLGANAAARTEMWFESGDAAFGILAGVFQGRPSLESPVHLAGFAAELGTNTGQRVVKIGTWDTPVYISESADIGEPLLELARRRIHALRPMSGGDWMIDDESIERLLANLSTELETYLLLLEYPGLPNEAPETDERASLTITIKPEVNGDSLLHLPEPGEKLVLTATTPQGTPITSVCFLQTADQYGITVDLGPSYLQLPYFVGQRVLVGPYGFVTIDSCRTLCQITDLT